MLLYHALSQRSVPKLFDGRDDAIVSAWSLSSVIIHLRIIKYARRVSSNEKELSHVTQVQ